MAITYTIPKPRGIITRGDLVYFSADVEQRVAICVLREEDANGAVLGRLRLEFRDDTTPSFADFASGTGGGQFRNAVEAYLATLAVAQGTQD